MGMRVEHRYFVYILASKPWGTLYVGVTSNVEARVHQHKEGTFKGFTRKYGVKHLVYFEEHGDVYAAIQREKRIKKWPRAWKINLIRTDNPDWLDLSTDWFRQMLTEEELENWIARTSRAMTIEGDTNV